MDAADMVTIDRQAHALGGAALALGVEIVAHQRWPAIPVLWRRVLSFGAACTAATLKELIDNRWRDGGTAWSGEDSGDVVATAGGAAGALCLCWWVRF